MNNIILCPICGSKNVNIIDRPGGKDVSYVECDKCGNYFISRTMLATINHICKTDKEIISIMLRRNWENNNNKQPVTLYSNYENIIKEYNSITQGDKISSLLEFVYNFSRRNPGKFLNLSENHRYITASVNIEELLQIRDHLVNKGVFELSKDGNSLRMSINGMRALDNQGEKPSRQIGFRPPEND